MQSIDFPSKNVFEVDRHYYFVQVPITFEQAKKFSTALLRGDPEEGGIIKESVKSVVEGILPHRG